MSRIERVNQQVKREISRIIQLELSDPRLEFVSITGVEVSKDLRNARVYFSVLGDESRVEAAATGLNGAGGTIRGLLSKKLNMRNTPELRFYHDKSIEYSSYVEETLKEINDEHNSDQ
ncbi:MAG: ribosome-binding factor A [Omnitrophica WOR_2 bacterium GWA2_37_7]|nr:MAG: ribosome-binding factor A [Omnitrophica WOR_2 bacterium GWA2_37_7]OGX51441.1 MAG: ribosome-binding factor A [Omnitrophica WOR_2 bacterium RIFOXYA12_FULL_38_10]